MFSSILNERQKYNMKIFPKPLLKMPNLGYFNHNRNEIPFLYNYYYFTYSSITKNNPYIGFLNHAKFTKNNSIPITEYNGIFFPLLLKPSSYNKTKSFINDIINDILDEIDYDRIDYGNIILSSLNDTNDILNNNEYFESELHSDFELELEMEYSSSDISSASPSSSESTEYNNEQSLNNSKIDVDINHKYFTIENSKKSSEVIIDGFELINPTNEFTDESCHKSDSFDDVNNRSGIPRESFLRVGNYLYERAMKYNKN
jgi:hypothetical protein